jgi:two-component sensor histidine kinase
MLKQKLCGCLIVPLLFSFAYGQSEKTADTTQIVEWVYEAFRANRFNIPGQDSLLLMAAEKSRDMGRHDYVSRIFHTLSFLKQQQSQFLLARQFALEALRAGEKIKGYNPSYLDAMVNAAQCYYYLNQIDSCQYLRQRALRIAREHHDEFNMSVLFTMEAFLYESGIPDEARERELYDSAILLASRTPSLHDDVFASFNKATFVQARGGSGWGESLELLTAFQDKVDDPSLIQRPVEPYRRSPLFYRNTKNTLNMMLAIIYLNLSDLDNARYYMVVTVDNYKKDKNPYLSYVMSDLAMIESIRGDNVRASQLYDSVKLLVHQITRTDAIPYPSFYYMAGWVAEQEKEYEVAIQKYTQSSRVAEFYFPPVALPALLRVMLVSGKITWADSLVKALQASDYRTNPFFQIPYLKELSRYYETKGDPIKAMQTRLRHFELKDSLTQAARYYAMKEVETRFKTKEKEKELALSRREQEQQRAELNQKKRETFYLAGGMAILVFLSVALYSNYRTKNRQARELAQKNHQIEVLIKELHHRVKNNMQTISSLLGLQSYRVTDEQAKSALREGQTRVEAMALIHQKLYLDSDLRAVDMEQYLKALIATLAQSYGYDPAIVRSDITLPDKNLDVDVAIPLGLIINELIINAFKYAFDQVRDPQLNVVLRKNESSQLELVVRDNGSGLPEGLKPAGTSFGLRLVQTLTRQLNASLMTRNEDGAVFQIVFNK